MGYGSRKIGFWSVFALVVGAQIGTGAFMLPTSLAPFGIYALLGWIFSSIGALALALVFAKLCAWFPKTGGPHVYVERAFGPSCAFFVGWTYWLISWISTTVVVIASIGYLMPLLPSSPPVVLGLEVGLIILITLLNFRGVSVSGRIEFFLTLLKVIPLCIIPLLALVYFDVSNFMVDTTVASLPLMTLLGRVTLLALWGFIGVESATTPAESVENPSKTIPRAIVAGTLCAALLYFVNSLAIMGCIPGTVLLLSNAPYADASQLIFGGNWHLILSTIASIICIGTLNAWTLTSGQIALGLAQDALLPKFFGAKNSYDAPYWSLGISCVGIILLLFMTTNATLAAQVLTIIDFSVTAFLFVYLACCLAYFKLLAQRQGSDRKALESICGIVALLFCCWVLYETPVSTVLIAGLFTLSGLPLYAYYRLKLR